MSGDLVLRDLRAGYGPVEVLHGVDFAVPPRGITALLGRNGAGKSTTLAAIAGLVAVRSGSMTWGGEDITRWSTRRRSRAGMLLVPEQRGVFPDLTVGENLDVFAADEVEQARLPDAFAAFPVLQERLEQRAGSLSGGEQQMLAMSRALLVDPAVLLLDEISMGLAPLIVAELYELVGSLAQQGIAILLVEQFAQTALAVADHAVILSHGRVTRTGTPAEVEEHLSAAYLGGAA
jgi:branched-chain amino acid transport system ATP-binding protein